MKYNTITIKNYSKIREEYKATTAILPGMLLDMSSTSGYVKKHAGAGRTSLPMFAIEDALQGKAIDEAYVANDPVQVWIPTRGDIVYALLADEESVVIGDFVESNGAGYLRKRVPESWESADAQATNTIYDHSIVGQVLEAKDLTSLEGSDSSAATATTTQFILIRII
jgi:hypothetical protein